MPLVLGNTTVTDNYPANNQQAGAILGYSNDVFTNGYVFVANNAVFLRFLRGNQGQMQESADLYLAPGYYPLTGGASPNIGTIGGFKMRNAIAGTVAQAAGALFYPGEAQVGTGQPFSGSVSAAGGVTPGATKINGVTGSISAAGAVLAGTGFTVAHPGAGQFQVTFTPVLTTAPIVVATVVDGGAHTLATMIAAPTNAGVNVDLFNPVSATFVDAQWNFIAIIPQ